MSPRFALPAVLTAALLLLPSSAPAADGFSVRPLEIDVVVGPDDDVPCTVQADLYVPDGASAAAPVPAILTTNGFGGSKADQRKTGEGFSKRGYAVLSYSGLGFGGSDCKISLDDRDFDGKAGSQLVTFLGGGKAAKDGTTIDFVRRDARGSDGRAHEHDPRVGMVGGSYGGQVQFAVAGIDPRLDTIVPLITWNDLSYSLVPNNTSFFRNTATYETPGVNKMVWSTFFFAAGIASGVRELQGDPGRALVCPNFDDRICAGKVQLDATGTSNAATTAALRHASVASFIDQIRVPTFLIQGQADTLFNLQEAVATYRALKGAGTPVKMTWQRGGHSGPQAKGELDLSLVDPTYLGGEIAAWFDHYLKDDVKVPSLDFTFFRGWVGYDGKGPATPAYGRAPAYPAAQTERLRLSADGTLRRDGDKLQDGASRLVTTAAGLPTSYTEIPVLNPGSEPVDAPGTTIAFSTPPLEEDVDVVGVPKARLRLAADLHALTGQAGAASGLVLFLRLQDVAPDGSVTLPFRLISPIRVADASVPVDVELPGIVHRFRKGHRLQLVVSGGDLAYRAGNVPGPVTLRTSAARPSTLDLPVSVEGRDYGAVVAASAPPRTCASRRAVALTVRRAFRSRLRSGRIVVDGRRVATLSPNRTRARVSLRGRPKQRVTVRIVMTLRGGETVTDTRRFQVCTRARR